MARVIIVIALIIGSVAAWGQQAPPELSRSTQLSIQALATEVQQIQKDFTAVDEAVKKEHPGWHLSQNLKVEKDIENPQPAVKEGPNAAKKP